MKSLKNNIKLLYLFQFIGSFEFIQPFFVLFLFSRGLSFTQVMLLQSYWFLIILLMEIPSGAFSDKYGRTKAIQFSALMACLGFFVYAQSYTIVGFIVSETFIALAYAFFSGTDAAFIYDTLKEQKKEKLYEKTQSNSNIINLMTYGISSFFAGFILFLGYNNLLYLTALIYFVAFLITLFLEEPTHYKSVREKSKSTIKEAIKHAVNNKKVRFALLYSSFVGVSLHFVYFMIQPYLKYVSVPESFFGLVYLAYFSFASLGYYFSSKIIKKVKRKKLIGLIPITIAILFLLSFFFYSKYSVILLLLAFIPNSVQNIITLVLINENTKTNIRATTISIKGFIYSLIFMIIAPLIGLVSDNLDPSYVFLLLSIPLFLFSTYYLFIKKDIKDKTLA